MGGITCNAEGLAVETGAVNVPEGGERDTNELLSCSHYAWDGLVAGCVASNIPHSDAASQNALDVPLYTGRILANREGRCCHATGLKYGCCP